MTRRLKYVPEDRLSGPTVRITLRLAVDDGAQLRELVERNRARAGSRYAWPRPADLSSLCRLFIMRGVRQLGARKKRKP